MHPYLERLGVSETVDAFFSPHFRSDGAGNMVFEYGRSVEHYGLSFHLVPNTEEVWLAGSKNFHVIRRVFIGFSALDAIAYFNWHLSEFAVADNLLFVSLGRSPNSTQLRWLSDKLGDKEITLLFGQDMLGRVADVKTAAAISRQPLNLGFSEGVFTVDFRLRQYVFEEDKLTLNALEKVSGYRFNIKTHKPSKSENWFACLKNKAFNQNV